jgi:nitrite reductase/ring-hydroxylating ferredoxin subunit
MIITTRSSMIHSESNKMLLLIVSVKIIKMKQLVLRSRKYLLGLAFMTFIHSGCNEIDSQIPDVPVYLEINLNTYNELTIPGNSLSIPRAGFGGVIIYCEIEGSYYAFDAACTNEINQSCTVKNEGVVGTCSCCGSQFVFIGGAPTKGPAAAPLKPYKTALYGNLLRVYN